MSTAVVTRKPLAAARLWDQDFNLLATELCSEHDETSTGLTIEGKGPIYQAVYAHVINNPGSQTYLTIDPDSTNLHDFNSRHGYVVTDIRTNERRCECGNPIITTTITGEPTQATA